MAYLLSNLFGPSPFESTYKHMDTVSCSVQLIDDFVSFIQQSDWKSAKRIRKKIVNLEHEADSLKLDIRLNLPQLLLLPISRTDLLSLLSMQDKLANRAKDLTGLMLDRKMIFPEQIVPLLRNLLDETIQSSERAKEATKKFDEWVASGSITRKQKEVIEAIEQVDAHEQRCDRLQKELRDSIMQLESTLPPIQTMFYYQAISVLGEISDIAHRIGSRLSILIAK